MTTAPSSSQPLRAALWMLGAVASFSTLAVMGRELSQLGLSTFAIMFWRSALGLAPILAVIAFSRGGFSQLATSRIGLHAGRHSIHFIGQNLWFYAITLITFAEVVALEFTSPIWVALLAPVLLGERLTQWRVIAALCGFVGVLVITQPGVNAVGLGQMVALGAAISFALTNIGTKSLTRTDSTLCIVFWMTLSQAIMALICEIALNGGVAPPQDAALWRLLIILGAAGFAAHFTLTSAYRLADATVVAPMEFARLPVVATIGALVYAELLDPWVLIGGVIIFFGNFLNIRAETRAKTAHRMKK